MKSKLCIILISSAVFVLSLRCFTLSPSPKAPSVANTAQVTTERPSEELASAEATTESNQSETTTATEIIANDSTKFPPKITLSGNHDEHFIADKMCYYEGDKFFLMIDEGVDLPGDLANNIALIIDKIEEKTGLMFKTSDDIMGFDCCTIKYGYNPWDGFNFGHKVPIFICVDRDGAGYISHASAEHANIYLDELYSMDLWNSLPQSKDYPSSRQDYVNYYVFAHELTHVLTERHASLTKIMTEGSADYFAEQVINSLSNVSRDFTMSNSSMMLFNSVKDTVTAENAEAIFRNDYIDLSTAERGDEYTLGRLICSYLAQSYGDTFMKDYLSVLADNGFSYTDMVYTHDLVMINKQTDLFKKLFGDDTFIKFAAYYNSLN